MRIYGLNEDEVEKQEAVRQEGNVKKRPRHVTLSKFRIAEMEEGGMANKNGRHFGLLFLTIITLVNSCSAWPKHHS